ncbi:hypothetical protein [Nocardia asiatica]|uniref:hypothetical protein n=1 Tax=Nocardia asiatica TaxID=209252 RepID=UPI002455ECEF|nr:hypothetical protein [Nocardia asiatica]
MKVTDMMDDDLPLFPNAEHLQRAFRGDVVISPSRELTDAASALIPVRHQRRAAIRQMYEPDLLPNNALRQAVRDFNAAENQLAVLATSIDQTVARMLRGRQHVAGMWHTETVGLVVSRLAELWLNYWDSQAHEDAYQVARISDAYNCLVAELATGRRLPPDM